MTSSGIEEFIMTNEGDVQSQHVVQAFVDTLKDRIDKVKDKDIEVKTFAEKEKKRVKRATNQVDSDLSGFL